MTLAMAVVSNPTPVGPLPPGPSTGSSSSTGQLAPAWPGSDPAPVINAHEANLADYLNRPVQDILARLGIPHAPGAIPPPSAPTPETPPGTGNPSAAPAPSNAAPSGPSSPIDPTQLITPVTDALGTLGSGQFGNLDPTQMLGGLSQALESAGQSVQQALTSLGSSWQGDAGTAAAATTGDALKDGAQVARQSTDLSTSLSTATASVAQAEARLIEIINEFYAKIAAIGPNIIFPWGIAAAIEAANQAITTATEVVTELQGNLAGQATKVAAAGAPVAVTSAPTLGANFATSSVPAVRAAPALAQSIGPLLQTATGLVSPVMQEVSAISGAAKSAAANPPDGNADKNDPGGIAPNGAALGGRGAIGGGSPGITQSRLAAPTAPTAPETTSAATDASAFRATPAGMAGSPMMGGAPMAAGGKAGIDGRHSAASFLHTSDQGDEIVGDLGNVAPPVIGQPEANHSPDIELRI